MVKKMASFRNPLISVITVCRNSAATIGQAIESVLNQSYRRVDYIVVDGASSDGTLDTVKHFEGVFKSKEMQFRWISEPDEGIYDAMNKGIKLARGDIIGLLNSDDFYESNTLEVVSDISSTKSRVGVFYGFLRFLREGEELQVYRYRYENYLLDLNMGVYSAAQHPTCFVRQDVYDQIGLFDTQFSIAADYDFLIRAMRAGIEFFPIDAVLCNYRSGGASDQMSDYERLKQRNAVLYKNNLLSEEEYQKQKKRLGYTKYKSVKRRLLKWLFRF